MWVKQPPDGFKLSLKLLCYRRYFFYPVFVLDLCVCDSTPPLSTSLFWIPSVYVAALWLLSVRYCECPVRVSPSWVSCVCFVVLSTNFYNNGNDRYKGRRQEESSIVIFRLLLRMRRMYVASIRLDFH